MFKRILWQSAPRQRNIKEGYGGGGEEKRVGGTERPVKEAEGGGVGWGVGGGVEGGRARLSNYLGILRPVN